MDMTNAPGAQVSRAHEIGIAATAECCSLRTSHQNILLEGADAAMKAALDVLLPLFSEPVLWSQADVPLELPTERRGTLILRDVGALRADDQNRLLRWLEASNQLPQIVSMSATPLFSLVARGAFDEALYYRLNVMLLRAEHTAGPAPYPDHPDDARDTLSWADRQAP
jgi:hypothetical protein